MVLEIIVLFIGICFLYAAWQCFKSRKFGRVVLSLLAAAFFIGGSITMITSPSDSSSSSQSKSSSKSSSSDKSESNSEKKQSEADSSHKKQAQQGVDDINKKIAGEPDLAGLKVKLDKYDEGGQDYDVILPDNALGGNDNQTKEICKNVFTIIKNETGNQSPTVFYYDQAGNEVARTKWDGSIKLDN